MCIRDRAWAGTDRQARGALLQLLRQSPDPLTSLELATAWPTEDAQRGRCLASLIEDGLVDPLPDGRYALPR